MNTLEPDTVVPWGRSFAEYVSLFALTESDLSRSILDCAGGPSSFNAEMQGRGHDVISVDPIYADSLEEIGRRIELARDVLIRRARENPDRFVWSYIPSPQHLREIRMSAMQKFLVDYATDSARDRYLPQSLPNLTFADKQFELALCSHFLFLYSEQLDARFHVESVREMLRVAQEVRIFPVTDFSGELSPHLSVVRCEFSTELVAVPYEFLRGANQMLIVTIPSKAQKGMDGRAAMP